VVFLIKINMRVKRCRTNDYHHDEKSYRQEEIGASAYQKHRNEEERRIVAFAITKVRLRDKMIFGIEGVVEVDMVMEEWATYWVVTKNIMHQRLPKRHN
jgi:hypothetical protein